MFICGIYMLLFFFKALNTEIKMKRETVDSVLRDNEACVTTIRVSYACIVSLK